MWKFCAIILTTLYCLAGAAKIATIAQPLLRAVQLENATQEDAKSKKDTANFEDLFHARKLLHSSTRQKVAPPFVSTAALYNHTVINRILEFHTKITAASNAAQLPYLSRTECF